MRAPGPLPIYLAFTIVDFWEIARKAGIEVSLGFMVLLAEDRWIAGGKRPFWFGQREDGKQLPYSKTAAPLKGYGEEAELGLGVHRECRQPNDLKA